MQWNINNKLYYFCTELCFCPTEYLTFTFTVRRVIYNVNNKPNFVLLSQIHFFFLEVDLKGSCLCLYLG